MNNFPLSKNYTFFDLTISSDYPELVNENRQYAIEDRDNGGHIIDNMKLICENILEPIVLHTGEVPKVLSGYRFPKLNKAVGGSFYSWHKRMDARLDRGAVDYTLWNYGIKNLFFDIVNGEIDIKFHKVIYYKNNHFLHISLPTGWGDNKILIKDKGKFRVVA